jgi:hypothetical protein
MIVDVVTSLVLNALLEYSEPKIVHAAVSFLERKYHPATRWRSQSTPTIVNAPTS